jgi:hypothetical protein
VAQCREEEALVAEVGVAEAGQVDDGDALELRRGNCVVILTCRTAR